MKPSSSNLEKVPGIEASRSSPAPDGTRLTRREVISTLCLGLAIAGVAAGIAVWTSKRDAPAAPPSSLDHPRRLVPFHLTERSGRTITETDVAGKFLVVNFVFTSCTFTCRAVNERMGEIQGLVGEAKDVQLLSLTVDPRTDTPAALSTFADSFHADTDRWLFLTGEKAQLYGLFDDSFASSTVKRESFIPGDFPDTDRIMLVDPRGNVCASFNGLKRDVAKTVVAEIENLRRKTNFR